MVLVHGAWADGSSWAEVIARLQERGLSVVAAQNPLSSLGDDVAVVNRAIEAQRGPVVLVGHAWGGTVITQAGAADRVAALVYIAAFAPDLGESTNDLQRRYPPRYLSLLQLDAAGYLRMPGAALQNYFAQDVPEPQAKVLAATQGTVRARAFDEPVSVAAWRSKPSWYLVTGNDRMIDPRLQREMAARIGARVDAVPASHVPFITRPKETTAAILRAVDGVAPAADVT